MRGEGVAGGPGEAGPYRVERSVFAALAEGLAERLLAEGFAAGRLAATKRLACRLAELRAAVVVARRELSTTREVTARCEVAARSVLAAVGEVATRLELAAES